MLKEYPVEKFISYSYNKSIVDIRKKVDFQKGHMPHAINLPFPLPLKMKELNVGSLLENFSNHYLKDELLSQIFNLINELDKNSPVFIYCSTGKIHSPVFSSLLENVGINAFVLMQGYRAYRDFVQKSFEKYLPLIVISGKTGCGKTAVLQELEKLGEQVIDLESLAQHKGSVFGGLEKFPQPTHDQFQNNLCYIWNRLDCTQRVWIEDKAKIIGSVGLPDALWKKMEQAPRIVLNIPQLARIDNIIQGYRRFENAEFEAAILKIKKRFGEKNAQNAIQFFRQYDITKTVELLLSYYDNAYEYILNKKRKGICFTTFFSDPYPEDIALKTIKIAESISFFS